MLHRRLRVMGLVLDSCGCCRAAGHKHNKLLALTAGLASLGAPGCEPNRTLEANVPAQVGIHQVAEADGPLMDEDVACAALESALSQAKADNNCDEVTIPACPELIRPGGSLACLRYVENSVTSCADEIQGYDSCDRVAQPLCVVTAVTSEMTEGCVPPMPPGEAGVADAATGDAATTGPNMHDGGTPLDSSTPPGDSGMQVMNDSGAEPVNSEAGLADSAAPGLSDASNAADSATSSASDASPQITDAGSGADADAG